jgi:dolichol-phosphate mannosyltransferase
MNQDHVVMFGLVGCSGVVVNLGVLARHVGFAEAQTAAILTAMTSNYFLNNALTYRDRRLHGWRFLSGLVSFVALCGLGVLAAVGVSTLAESSRSCSFASGGHC